jgi:hypothetical protein
LFRVMVDAGGIEPPTCRLRDDGKAFSTDCYC